MSEETMQIQPSAEKEFGYGQLFGILVRRRFWFLGAFLTAIAAATAVALLDDPIYTSSMRLLVEPNYQGRGANQNSSPEREFADSTVEIDYATQLSLMRSSKLLLQAVDRLIADYPDIEVSDIRNALTLTRVIEDNAADRRVETKIFEAQYVSDDPVKTQNILEAIQQVYLDYNLEQQEQRLRDGLAFINEQLPTVRDEVSASAGALEQFRENENLIDPTQQAAAISGALQLTRQERETLQAQLSDTQARYRALQNQLGQSLDDALTSARLSQSTRYQNLLDQLQATELELEQERTLYRDNHPTVNRLLDRRERQLTLLEQEIGRSLGSVPSRRTQISRDLLTEGQMGETDQALVNQLVATRTELLGLEARDRSLAVTQQQLESEVGQYPSLIAQYETLQPEVDINLETLQQLLTARQDLGIELARGGFNWQIVEAPQLGQSMSDPLKTILLGTVVGIFLGGIAAFIREAADDAVHTSDQLQQQTVLPLLGVIPELPPPKVSGMPIFQFRRSEAAEVLPDQILYSANLRESFDLIYKNIQFLQKNTRSLVITSALPGEGKSTFSLGVALSAARQHSRVLLIDADLRRPSLHHRLGLSNDYGLSTILSGQTNALRPLRITLSDSVLDVLPSGPMPDDPVKQLSSQRMQRLLNLFEQAYDLIVIDTPPILGLVDALQTASFGQGVIMVGRINRLTQSELTQAVGMLSHLHVLGLVANGAREHRSSYSRYARYVESTGDVPVMAMHHDANRN